MSTTRKIALFVGQMAYKYPCARKLYKAGARLIAPIGKSIDPNYRAGAITAYLDSRYAQRNESAAERDGSITYLPVRSNAEFEETQTNDHDVNEVSAEDITEALFWEAEETLSYIKMLRRHGCIIGMSGTISLLSATVFFTTIYHSMFGSPGFPIPDSPKDIIFYGLYTIASSILFTRSTKKLNVIERRFKFELFRIITLAMEGKTNNPAEFGVLDESKRLVPNFADETTYKLWQIYFTNRGNPKKAEVESQSLIDKSRNPEKMKMMARFLKLLMEGDEKRAKILYRWLQQSEKDKPSDQE